ncbi:MAG TPA: S8 family serine peptidase, partial [Anaerolineae bacterium]|nr:S8 family serine peptidase [Anaerolineae bacterium]
MVQHRLPRWLTLTALPLFVFMLVTAQAGSGASAPSGAQPIVEPSVLKAVAGGGQAEFIIYLRAAADLAPARRVPEGLDRRTALVDVLRSTAESSQRELRAVLQQLQAEGHVQETQPLWIVNAVVVQGDAEALKVVANRPDVERIRANRRHRLDDPMPAASASPETTAWNVRAIGANRVWDELGISGQGTVVANMDTGVDWLHPALQPAYRGTAGNHDYSWFDATGTYPRAPNDGDGHGTHTMGTMVGYAPNTNGGPRVGIAPGAHWIAVKVFDDERFTTDAILHQGFQWIIAPTDLDGANPDPGLAPDVLNSSWGAPNIADPTFWDDVEVIRAAGILPVFSGGNRGSLGPGSVGTPSGFPQSFSVAATDANELLADFSSVGPSYWGEIKPDVAAPGEAILSTLPGGGYGSMSGTSMAAPHAAATAALLLEANPLLSVDDLEHFISHTAYDLGAPGPDNQFGAGQIDAFAATSWALGAGTIAGQVNSADTGLPVASARVMGVDPGGDHTFSTASDRQGAYTIAVPAGVYDVTAAAFGYNPQSLDGVQVVTGYQSLRDFQLAPLPSGTVSGRASETWGGFLGPVTVSVEGTSVETLTDRSGYYTLVLPMGTHSLVAVGRGHRTARAEVQVVADETTRQDFLMEIAPNILLVDADAWQEDDVTLYYENALDAIGYPYDTLRITDTATVPSAGDLRAFDVVVWVQAWSSPGSIDAQREDQAVVEALTSYLLGGGRLLLVGQDIGYWDGDASYYRQLLHAGYLQDQASADVVRGLPGTIMEGSELDLRAVDAYKYLDSPDVVAAASNAALPLADYGQAGQIAALQVEDRGYRVVYLAFGLESGGPGSERAQVLDRALSWLGQPMLSKQMTPATASPGERLQVTLTIHNPLQATRELVLRDTLPDTLHYVEDSGSPTVTYNEAEGSVTWEGSVSGRESVTIHFAATLANDLHGDTVIRNTALLDLPYGPPVQTSASVQVEAPNLILSEKTVRPASTIVHLPLVPSTGGQATASLGQSGLSGAMVVEPNDLLAYHVALRNSSPVAAPSVQLIDPLPPEVTYVEGSLTGGAQYNQGERRIEWSGTLPAALPGQADYEWTGSDDPGGPSFDWQDISDVVTSVRLGDDEWAGPFGISFPFQLYGQTFSSFYVSSNGWLSLTPPGSSESHNDPLPSESAPGNLIALFWDDLNPAQEGVVRYHGDGERLVVSFTQVPRYSSGGPYTFQAVLTPDGRIILQYLSMGEIRLDEATIGIQNNDGSRGLEIAYDETFVHDSLALLITPPQEQILAEHAISFQVRVNTDVSDNSRIVNEAVITAGGATYERSAALVVKAADLSASHKQVSSSVALPNDVLTYTITLINSPAGSADVTMTDVLPPAVGFVEGSATGGAAYDAEGNRVTWRGQLGAGEEKPFTFSVRLDPELASGMLVSNTAIIDDGVHPPLARTVITRIEEADLAQSYKVTDRSIAVSGEVLTYT